MLFFKAFLALHIQLARMISIPNLIQGTLNKYQVIDKDYVEEELQVITRKYQFPASFKRANIHKNAIAFGYNASKMKNKNKKGNDRQQDDDQGDNNQADNLQLPQLFTYKQGRPKLCPCCNQAVNTQPIPLCYHTTDINSEQPPFKLTSGTSMFFSFIKMSITYLLFVFILSDCYNIITSLQGNYCQRHNRQCQGNLFGKISTYNKYKDDSMFHEGYILDLLCLITVILSLFFFVAYRKIQYNIYEQVDMQDETQDDFSLFVENIPVLDFKQGSTKQDQDKVQFDYEQDLKVILEQKILKWIDWMQENINSLQENSIEGDLLSMISIQQLRAQPIVKSVSLCFNLAQLEKIQATREALMQEEILSHKDTMKSDSYVHQRDLQGDLTKIPNQIDYLNKMEVDLCKKYAVDNTPTFNVTHFVGKAFVSFQYQHFRQHILQKYQNDRAGFLKYEGKPLNVERAIQPSDVFWKNMRLTSSQRIKKVVTSYTILLMIIIFAACGLLITNKIKTDNTQKGGDLSPETIIFNYGLTILEALITTSINFGIRKANTALTAYQKHQTRQKQQTSLIVKMLISQFINTAFIYFLISLTNWRPLMSSAGLVVQVSFLLVVSGIVQIAVNFINIPIIMRAVWLNYIYGYINFDSKKNVEVPTFQIKLNKDFELPNFDISQRYSYYLRLIYTALFYSYLVPIGVPVVAIIFTIQFWIDKFNMFRTSSKQMKVNYFLSRSALKLFETSILFYALGNLLFSILLHETYMNILNLVSLLIALVYVGFITFAPSDLERKLFAKYQTFEKISYEQCIKEHKFDYTYWTQNPATVFVKEVDINDENYYVDQGSDDEYYDIDELLDELVENEIQKNPMQTDGW